IYCVFTVILLFSTTCYWGADRCWVDLNRFHIFDPIRHMDGSPTSTFGLRLPAFMNTVDDYLETFLRILGGGEPLAKVIRVGSDLDFARSIAATTTTTTTTTTTAAAATTTAAASTITAATSAVTSSLDSISDAISAVLSAVGMVAQLP
ncbi:hypothetical protein BGX21_007888, partial [Mortierella sp. AD011]